MCLKLSYFDVRWVFVFKNYLTELHYEMQRNKMIKKRNKHGGERKGSGRKKKDPTKTIRVYESNVEDFKNINKHHPKEWEYTLK